MQEHEIFDDDEEPFVYHPTYKNVEEKVSKHDKRKEDEEEKAKQVVEEKKKIEYTKIDLDKQHETKIEYMISMIKWGTIFVIEFIVFLVLRKKFLLADVLYPLFAVFIVMVAKTCVFLVQIYRMKKGTFKRSYYELPPLMSDFHRIIVNSVILAITLGFAIYSFVDFTYYDPAEATVTSRNEDSNGNVTFVLTFSVPGVTDKFVYVDKKKYTQENAPYELGQTQMVLYDVSDPNYAKICNEYYVSLRTFDYAIFVYCAFGLYDSIKKYIEFKKKDLDLIEDLL